MYEMTIIQKVAVYALPLIFAITLHEAAHAYVANKYGDSTAKILGRMTVNPLPHIDLLGTIVFPMIGVLFGGFIFGWAKPVPINFSRLHNPKKNLFWVAFAGPLSNLAMALVWALILKASMYMSNFFGTPLSLMAQAGIAINISLMLINLVPILPLDGGRMLFSLLPNQQATKYARTEPYGMIILLLLLVIGLFNFVIQPIFSVIVNAILYLIR